MDRSLPYRFWFGGCSGVPRARWCLRLLALAAECARRARCFGAATHQLPLPRQFCVVGCTPVCYLPSTDLRAGFVPWTWNWRPPYSVLSHPARIRCIIYNSYTLTRFRPTRVIAGCSPFYSVLYIHSSGCTYRVLVPVSARGFAWVGPKQLLRRAGQPCGTLIESGGQIQKGFLFAK
jgi:hypothetical protein